MNENNNFREISEEELIDYVGLTELIKSKKTGSRLNDYKNALSRFGKDIKEIQENINQIIEENPAIKTSFATYKNQHQILTRVTQGFESPAPTDRLEILTTWKKEYCYLEKAQEIQDYLFEKAKANYFQKEFEENAEFEEIIKDCELSQKLYEANIQIFEKTKHLRD